jgi:transposase InsO family protein
MIVGWLLQTHMRTELVLDALEMASGSRRPVEGLIAHSDRGYQPELKQSSQRCRLTERIVVPRPTLLGRVVMASASASAEAA